jgi:hypothetical protein
MARSERIPQIYGYAVCLIAVVVMLMSVNALVDQAFLLSDPLAGSNRYGLAGGASLSSYESYRATRAHGREFIPQPGTGASAADSAGPSETELRAEYETLREDALSRVRFEARRELTQSAVLLLLAVALFGWHWRWVRGAEERARMERSESRETTASG